MDSGQRIGEQVVGKIELAALVFELVETRVGESAPSERYRREDVERNAAPAHAVGGQQDASAYLDALRVREFAERCASEVAPMRQRRGQRGLTKKVRHHLGGVVPAGVLEIDEAQLLARCFQRIMKTEIRRRNAALMHDELRVGVD